VHFDYLSTCNAVETLTPSGFTATPSAAHCQNPQVISNHEKIEKSHFGLDKIGELILQSVSSATGMHLSEP
jgi:hypothetical protein